MHMCGINGKIRKRIPRMMIFFATNIVESSTCAQNFVKKNIPNALGEERKIDSPEKTIFKAFWSTDFVFFLPRLVRM